MVSSLTRSFQTPQKKCRTKVSEAVRGDEDTQQGVNDVDGGGWGLSDAGEDEGDEEDVGEGGVDAPVERNPPLLAKPWGVVDTRTVCWPVVKNDVRR